MDDRFNTIAGWVLFAGIVGLGGSIASYKYFKHERPETMGYVIEGVELAGGAEAVEIPLGNLLETADAEAGARVFGKCAACHTIDQGGADGIGPNLFGVMGTTIGAHAAGFAYSPALSGHGGSWTWEDMDAWLTNPRRFADGTKMSFAGLPSAEDRANLMVYMESLGGAPARPQPVAIEAEAEIDPAVDAAVEETAEGDAVAAE